MSKELSPRGSISISKGSLTFCPTPSSSSPPGSNGSLPLPPHTPCHRQNSHGIQVWDRTLWATRYTMGLPPGLILIRWTWGLRLAVWFPDFWMGRPITSRRPLTIHLSLRAFFRTRFLASPGRHLTRRPQPSPLPAPPMEPSTLRQGLLLVPSSVR